MNAGGFGGAAHGAGMKGRTAYRTEAEMPARQEQYARFLLPAAPAHSVSPIAAARGGAILRRRYRFLVVAAAARLRVVRRELFLVVVLLLLVLYSRENLLQIASESVGGGLVRLSQISPYLILNAQRLHSLLQRAVHFPDLLDLRLLRPQFLHYVLLHRRRDSPGISLPPLVDF